jgi:hypothetical protein
MLPLARLEDEPKSGAIFVYLFVPATLAPKLMIFPQNEIWRTESKPVDAITNQGRQNNLFVDIRVHMVIILSI